MITFYLIHKESGEIIEEGKKGRLRRIQRKMEDRDEWKVSKNDTITEKKEKVKKTKKVKKGKKVKKEKKEKRVRSGGRLKKQKRVRKIKVKKETEKDLKRMIKAGVNTRCNRRKDKKGNEHEIELRLDDKLFAK